MSVQRALVDCTVLSLQDPCVFYPCCKNCFCRMDVESRDTTRSSCSRCAYSCVRDQLEYRYRLSLLVTRDTSIFGVTVFGSCLNPFFGIPATQFQRVLEKSDGPFEASTRSKVLARAVEDCFVSRNLVFGIKVTDSKSCPWSKDHNPDAFDHKDMAQFTATQLIFPKVAGLEGHSVLRYYRLLRRAEEHQRESVDPNKSCGILTTPRLQIPQDSAVGSFNNITLSRLFSHALQRSQHHDGSLTPTPPWQQSLGLVTSSAEQEEEEEDCCTCDDNQSTGKEKGRSTFFDTPPFSLCWPAENANSSILNHVTPSKPSRVNYPLASESQASRQQNDSPVTCSLVWEDLPFSESLTAFLNEEDKYFSMIRDKNLPNESISTCSNNTKAPGSKFRISADVANTRVLNEDSEEIYNCSLDLFGLSSVDPREEDVQPPRHQKFVKGATVHNTPSRGMTTHRDYPQCLDFIPSSQSTPIVRMRPSSSSSYPLSSTRHKNFSKRRSRKHSLAILGGILNRKLVSECDAPQSQSEGHFVIVLPTPAELKVENGSSQENPPSDPAQPKHRDAAVCDRNTQLDHTVNEMAAHASLFKDQTYDWSRDLFSDSV
ncbi:uncharacterized protein ddias [Hippocampus comes]|uniref:uncharacterized protein ddias n=1 Tax=Hippocampus comes TaxID=109280 RepID=UPI00094E217B|nr:PREDICTED: DNA damage-induced apoptosis suppressor protein [Hippocampus comes]